MRNTSNTAKFFIVCAVVFGIGLLTTALGAAFGGIEEFGKVAEKRGWGYSGPGDTVMTYEDKGEFDTVEVNADVDVILITEKYYTNKTWMKEHDITEILAEGISRGVIENASEDGTGFVPEAGHVLMIRGSKVEEPKITVSKGVLHIDSKERTQEKININFSGVPVTPTVYVFCPEKELKSINIVEFSGDATMYGTVFDKTDIETASGDVLMKDVKGNIAKITLMSGDVSIQGVIKGETDISSESGDVDLNGTFKGTSKIKLLSGDAELEGKFRDELNVESASGDVEFDTDLPSDKYNIYLEALSGDLEIREFGSTTHVDSGSDYSHKGSPNKLTIKAASGDIDAEFAAEKD